MGVEDDRTGIGVETLRRAIQENLFYRCGNVPVLATRSDYYLAVAYTVRDRLMQRWLSTARSCWRSRRASFVICRRSTC